MLRKITTLFGTHGIARGTIIIAQLFRGKKRARCYKDIPAYIYTENGLEVGGPSLIFSKKGLLPLYPKVRKMSNCNFSKKTLWEGEIDQHVFTGFKDDRQLGAQYIAEASSLEFARTETYRFVASSHMLEHSANPVKVLKEWARVIKTGGILILIVPNKDYTFDWKRPTTPLKHLIEDYENDTGEDDLTHLDEIIKYHDLGRDSGLNHIEELKNRSRENHNNRGLHQHTFNPELVAELLNYIGLEVLSIEATYPNHIIAVSKKQKHRADNSELLKALGKTKNKKTFYLNRNRPC